MAFTHGKNAKLFVDQYDLSSYFNDFTMAAKAGTAETTVYGKGAKTFIGGLKEGTISSKGFFDSGATANDQELAAALGRAANMAVSLAAVGSWAMGSRVIVSSSALTDYQISAPVANVVAVSFSAQADSGLSSGISLYDPALNILKSATAITANTTATGAIVAGVMPVTSTTGFPPSGAVITAGGATNYITYTSVQDATHLAGCVTVIGGGVVANADTVFVGAQDVSAATTSGLVACLHIPTLTGSSPSFTAKLQHSSDGVTWADLVSFNGGTAITAAGAYTATVAYGTTVNKYLRGFINSSASTTLTTFNALITAARQ